MVKLYEHIVLNQAISPSPYLCTSDVHGEKLSQLTDFSLFFQIAQKNQCDFELSAASLFLLHVHRRNKYILLSQPFDLNTKGSRLNARAGSIPQIRESWTMIPKEPIPEKEPVYELIPLKESILNEESILCG